MNILRNKCGPKMIHIYFGTHLREVFCQEETINYKADILIDFRKMIFILAQEKVERNPKPEYT